MKSLFDIQLLLMISMILFGLLKKKNNNHILFYLEWENSFHQGC